ncbi:MAG: hypothetical protein ABIP49_02945 [Lysobacterales bacterium]
MASEPLILSTAQANAAVNLLDNFEARTGAAKVGALQSFSVGVASAALAANAATLTIQLPGRAPVEATRSAFAGGGDIATWRGRASAGHDVLLTMDDGRRRGARPHLRR